MHPPARILVVDDQVDHLNAVGPIRIDTGKPGFPTSP